MTKLTGCSFPLVQIVLLAAVASLLAGCVGTVMPMPSGHNAYRLAILYPFDVDQFRMQTSNSVCELNGYKSEGANSNTVALSSGIAEGVTTALVKAGFMKEAPEDVVASVRSGPPGLCSPSRLLVVGDSWAAGHVAETGKDSGWPAMMEIPPELRQGVDGTTALSWSADSGGCLTRALGTPCDAVIVSLMGNDAFAAWGDRKITAAEIGASSAAMSKVISQLAGKGIPVYCLLYANPHPGDWKSIIATAALNCAIIRACPTGTRFIYSSAVLTDQTCWANGDIHPSFEGHVRLANLIKQTVSGDTP